MTKSQTIPARLWRLSLMALLGTVIAVLLLLTLALGGISNPRHVGTLVVHDDLDRDMGWTLHQGQIADGVYQVVLSGSKTHAFALSPYQTRPPCSIEIAARQIGGPDDAGYGLWWGDLSRGHYGVAAVNGNGYLTVFQSVDGKTRNIMAWQVFPRIHPQGATNTIQIDMINSYVLVRVNDEVVTTFEWFPEQPVEIGFYVETVSAGETIAGLDWLSIWQEANE
ncbi:MAG: hypothetical protein JXB07_15680 [Anaerolineae bacterium]|nr:hypothetical protein [Anaerolineae bacterium]